MPLTVRNSSTAAMQGRQSLKSSTMMYPPASKDIDKGDDIQRNGNQERLITE